MTIQRQEVERDENGFWTHPEFPTFNGEEHPLKKDVNDWLFKNNLKKIHYRWFEVDADESIQDRYYDGEPEACKEWIPKCEIDNAFLISIHDTEDGPVAIFVEANNSEKKKAL